MSDATKTLTDRFVEQHPEDAARLIERLPVEEAIQLFDELKTAHCAGVIAQMAPAAGSGCLAGLPPDDAGALIRELPADIAARLIRPLDSKAQERLLTAVPTERRRAISALASSTAGTIGSVTNPHVFGMPMDATVRQAQDQLRTSAIPYVYIIDRTHHLKGVAGVEVWAASPEQSISAVMNPNVVYLYVDADITAMLPHHGWHEFETLPVVDRDRLYIGAVSHKALRRVVGTDRTVASTETIFTTLLGLGELYWTGMLEVFMSLSPGALQTKADAQHRRGDDHDA